MYGNEEEANGSEDVFSSEEDVEVILSEQNQVVSTVQEQQTMEDLTDSELGDFQNYKS